MEVAGVQRNCEIKDIVRLESIKLTQNEMKKLDAFQMKNFRRILKMPPTHVDRTQTNNSVMNKTKHYGIQTQKFSECWKSQETTRTHAQG